MGIQYRLVLALTVMLVEVASTQAIEVSIPANNCVTLTYVHGAAAVKVDISLLFAMSTHTLTWAPA